MSNFVCMRLKRGFCRVIVLLLLLLLLQQAFANNIKYTFIVHVVRWRVLQLIERLGT